LAKAANRPPMADGSIVIRPEDSEDGGDVKTDQHEVSADPMAPLDKLYRFGLALLFSDNALVLWWCLISRPN